MKVCNHCKVNKPLSDFPVRSTGKPFFVCWLCKREYDKKQYKRHIKKKRETKLKSVMLFRKRNLAVVIEHLKDGCVDCGEKDPVVLQFDHRGEKSFSICKAIASAYSEKRMVEEIKKCDVRCANCHTRKTAKQQNWGRLAYALKEKGDV